MILNPFSEQAKKELNFKIEEIGEELTAEAVLLFRNIVKKEEKAPKNPLKAFHVLCMALSTAPMSIESRTFINEFCKASRKELNLRLIQKDDIDEIKNVLPLEEFEVPKSYDFHTKGWGEWNTNGMSIAKKDLMARGLMGTTPKRIFFIPWVKLEGMDLTQFYLVQGKALLSESAMMNVYEWALKKRIAEYMKKVKETMSKEKFQAQIMSEVKGLAGETHHIGSEGAVLSKNIYPPCILNALNGVGAGGRNFAVTVLLTSFLSYARLFPTTKVFSEEFVPEMTQQSVEILAKEVLPLLYDAAERCEPPFLSEEKMNLVYHLGFGMRAELSLENFNSSKWYLPPSCEKVRQGCGQLCTPDSFCMKGWYSLKKRDLLETTKGESSGSKIILALKAIQTKETIQKKTGLEQKELDIQLRALLKAGTIGEKKISSPFMYYLLRRRVGGDIFV